MVGLKRVNDLGELAELAAEIWNEYWVDLLSKEQIAYMIEKFQSKSAMEEQVKNENYTYFHITSRDRIIGYTGLCVKEDYLFISKFYIKKEFRNKGFGGRAFELMMKYAQMSNRYKLRLTVNKNNKKTILTYTNWGFRKIDSVVVDIGNGFVMDDYIMEYKIT